MINNSIIPKIFRQIAFNKAWRKLPRVVKKQSRKAITLFLENSSHPSLHTHNLKGKLSEFKSFSVNRDIRILFREEKDGLHFEGIGNHDDYFKKSNKI